MQEQGNNNTTEMTQSTADRIVALSSLIRALSQLLWPILAIIAVISLLDPIRNIISSRNLSIKVGEYQLSIDDVTEQQNDMVDSILKDIKTLSNRLSEIEQPSQTKSKGNPIAANKIDSILWVEDTPQNSALLIKTIRDQGVSVVIAHSTAEAMEKLHLQSFSLVISDMGRKEMENAEKDPLAGLLLLQKMKVAANVTPVVIFTSHSSKIKQQALENGALMVTDSKSELMRLVL